MGLGVNAICCCAVAQYEGKIAREKADYRHRSMSATLIWRVPKKGNSLPDALKFALRKRYSEGVHTMTEHDLPYLEGLRDGGVDGAQVLIDAINKHDEIEVWEQY